MSIVHSSAALDDHKRIYACCSDHKLYCFEQSGTALACFAGCRVNNFTRIAVMDELLISGSVRGHAYMWDTSEMWRKQDGAAGGRKIDPLVTLPHCEEVTCIGVEPASKSIFTCSDDRTVNKWSLFDDRYLDRRVIASDSSTSMLGDQKAIYAQKYVKENTVCKR